MLPKLQQISTSELRNQSGTDNLVIVDIRSPDAYNGWKEGEEARGGHIQGAKSLPAKWANYIDWIEIVRSKAIHPEHSLVIYGDDNLQTETVARLFQKAGYDKVRVYHDFISGWSADDQNPMEHLQRYRQLVPPWWLKMLIDTGTAPEYDNHRYVIGHTHYRNEEDYLEGHIPGAIDIDTRQLESTETWNHRSPAALQQAFERLGITRDTTVVLYGRFSFPDNEDPFPGSSAGHLAAMRCAWIMLMAGVKDVRLLNGGWQSWMDAGYEAETQPVGKQAAGPFGADIPARPELVVSLEEAENMIAADNENLVSVRSWPEFIGEVSGYNYIDQKGRIPGAEFANCGSDAYHMENYRNLDHTTREYHEIEDLWQAAGITPDKRNAFYCGTGWRGSEAFINAWLMGWPNIALFDGGWFEWANQNRPFETGVPKTGRRSRIHGHN